MRKKITNICASQVFIEIIIIAKIGQIFSRCLNVKISGQSENC